MWWWCVEVRRDCHFHWQGFFSFTRLVLGGGWTRRRVWAVMFCFLCFSSSGRRSLTSVVGRPAVVPRPDAVEAAHS